MEDMVVVRYTVHAPSHKVDHDIVDQCHWQGDLRYNYYHMEMAHLKQSIKIDLSRESIEG